MAKKNSYREVAKAQRLSIDELLCALAALPLLAGRFAVKIDFDDKFNCR